MHPPSTKELVMKINPAILVLAAILVTTTSGCASYTVYRTSNDKNLIKPYSIMVFDKLEVHSLLV
jgi:hypothetical protein